MMLQTIRRLFCVWSLLAAASGHIVMSQEGGTQHAFINPASDGGDIRIQSSDKPSLSTLLTITKETSIFYDYLRESSGLVERLANPLTSTTLFVPQNVAITSMVRKPHMGAALGGSIGQLESQDQEKERFAYLEQWLKRHIVAGTDVELEDGKVYTTLASDEDTISVEAVERAGDSEDLTNFRLQPGNARILSKKAASDGVIYVIDNVLH